MPCIIPVVLFKAFVDHNILNGSDLAIVKVTYLNDTSIKLSCVASNYPAVVYGIK